MEFVLADPLTTFHHHHSDTIPDLFHSEADHMPSPDFLSRLKTTDFYISFRNEAISLILQAQFSCNFDPFISYLAVNYMDRFISKQEILQEKRWISRLLVVACLSLAAKMKNFPLSLSDVQSEEGLIFDGQRVHKMELLILDTLSWRMRSTTPFSFFDYFLSFFEVNNMGPLEQALKDQASEIIFNSQNEIKFLEFKPSIMAASALLSASHELFPSQSPSFKASISSCQYINNDNLFECLKLMQEMEVIEESGSSIETDWSRRTPMSVLEGNVMRSESENRRATGNGAHGSEVVSEKRDNKRRKLNGLWCSSNSRFQLSQW
ncbi:hypothetical protein UlMin_011716 [Ulmus minor]